MQSVLVNARDQRFILFEQLGIEELFAGGIFADFTRDDALMMLREAEKMALTVLYPTYRDGDRQVHPERRPGIGAGMFSRGLRQVHRGQRTGNAPQPLRGLRGAILRGQF